MKTKPTPVVVETPKKTSPVKMIVSAVVLAAFVVLGGVMLYKNHSVEQSETALESKSRNEKVAYLSDIDGHIAMFVIPMNYSTNGHWSGFEIKASTNNFRRPVNARATGNDPSTLAFYSQSATADKDIAGEDKMKVFVSNFEQNHERDYRSYCYITNTLAYTNWYNSAIVLIDTECLNRNPEVDEDGNSVWLHYLNKDLIWVYGRLANNDREMNPAKDRINLWTPIQPVRWFTKMPNWGGTFEQLKGQTVNSATEE